MKLFKITISILGIFCLCLSLLGCTLIFNDAKHFKDTNGENDHSLSMISEKEICAVENKCYCVLFGLNPEGKKSYDDSDFLHDADYIEAVATSPLSGVSYIQVTYGLEDSITFTVESERTAGNLRIVLLDENYNIIHDFDIDGESQYTVNNAKGKEFEIRVAGEEAKFVLKVTREFS